MDYWRFYCIIFIKIKKIKISELSIDLVNLRSCMASIIGITLLPTIALRSISLVILWNNWIVYSLNFFLLAFVFLNFSVGVIWNPALNFINFIQNLFLLILWYFVFNIIQSMFYISTVSFKSILGLNFSSHLLILVFKFLCLFD